MCRKKIALWHYSASHWLRGRPCTSLVHRSLFPRKIAVGYDAVDGDRHDVPRILLLWRQALKFQRLLCSPLLLELDVTPRTYGEWRKWLSFWSAAAAKQRRRLLPRRGTQRLRCYCHSHQIVNNDLAESKRVEKAWKAQSMSSSPWDALLQGRNLS